MLTCQASFTKEVARSQHPHDRHSADFIDNRELYTAILNVHHTRSGIALRIDLLGFSIFHEPSGCTTRLEKSVDIEDRRLHIFEFLDHRG